MALQDAVVGATRRGQQITWTDADGNAENLTGATMTGRILDLSTGQGRAIAGTLALVTAASGVFSWAYDANDVNQAGEFEVQFIATIGGAAHKSFAYAWTVHKAL